MGSPNPKRPKMSSRNMPSFEDEIDLSEELDMEVMETDNQMAAMGTHLDLIPPQPLPLVPMLYLDRPLSIDLDDLEELSEQPQVVLQPDPQENPEPQVGPQEQPDEQPGSQNLPEVQPGPQDIPEVQPGPQDQAAGPAAAIPDRGVGGPDNGPPRLQISHQLIETDITITPAEGVAPCDAISSSTVATTVVKDLGGCHPPEMYVGLVTETTCENPQISVRDCEIAGPFVIQPGKSTRYLPQIPKRLPKKKKKVVPRIVISSSSESDSDMDEYGGNAKS